MQQILICGAGKIGRTVAQMLAHTNDYHVFLSDINIEAVYEHINQADLSDNITLQSLDISSDEQAQQFFESHKIDAVISALPYTLTKNAAKLAKKFGTHYFDPTEDIETTDFIEELAQDASTAFAPQCGLAPGFIDIVAHTLIQEFDEVHDVKLRCGALPETSSNALKYALTWSTDGVINEYGNPCYGIINGEKAVLEPLQDLEELQIDGATYEAFNTSGGIGSLMNTYAGQVQNMTYKTVRYLGHCEKMHFLMSGLKLNNDRDTLKKILTNAIPTTKDDLVIIFVSVTGKKNNEFIRESFVKKYYPAKLFGMECTAIQGTTASGICSVVDLVLSNSNKYKGFIKQETFTIDDIINNRFGAYLKGEL